MTITIYDTTLRDGAQTEHLALSVDAKLYSTKLLDELGIPYIEGGFAGSSQINDEYFRLVRECSRTSKIVAFGMTSKTLDVENDQGIKNIIGTGADAYAIVGKTIKKQVKTVLRFNPTEYLKIIKNSVDYLKATGKDVIFDAEHFFDGYDADPEYALMALEAAKNADFIVLCDTNGGSWHEGIYEITSLVRKRFPDKKLGIHCHNDRGMATVNSLVAVNAGAVQVQGTINGYGERTGNANLCELIPGLHLRGHESIPVQNLSKLTKISREFGRITGMRPNPQMPYVGKHAFNHTGGMHVDAMTKDPKSYEHVNPDLFGNERSFTLSDQSGKAAVMWWANHFGLEIPDKRLPALTKKVSSLQNLGYAQKYLLFYRELKGEENLFDVVSGYVIEDIVQGIKAEARLDIRLGGKIIHTSAKGNGPVNALDSAMKKVLKGPYPYIEELELVDYPTNLIGGEKGTEACVVVPITFGTNGEEFNSIASGTDIIQASQQALEDGYKCYLIRKRNESN